MASINVMIYESDPPADTTTIVCSDGRSFISLSIGDATISLPGFGSVCAAYARDLGIKLIEAAARIPVVATIATSPSIDDKDTPF